MIAGGPRSGKSNVLQALLAALVCQFPPSELSLYLVDYRGRALPPFEDLPHTRAYAMDNTMLLAPKSTSSPPASSPFIQLLEAEFEQAKQRNKAKQPISKRIIVAVSNMDSLETAELAEFAKLSRLAMQGQRLGIHFLLTSNDFSGTVASNTTIKPLRQERCAIVLGNHEVQTTNVGLAAKAVKWPANQKSVSGRGFLVEGGNERMVQFWDIDDTLLAELPALCQRDPEPPEQEGSMKENV